MFRTARMVRLSLPIAVPEQNQLGKSGIDEHKPPDL